MIFYDRDEASPMLAMDTSSYDTKWAKLKRHRACILVNLALICLYTAVSVRVVQSYMGRSDTSLHPLPGIDISYQQKVYSDFEVSLFAGPPSRALDESWHGLLANISLRVSGEEIKNSNQSSVGLPGGGYMVWLGVYHELHCIKMLRQWNYREHYHPGLTEKERTHWDIHADHCLELLRSAAMCHGDTTLTTFRWAEQEQPMLNTRLTPHKCIDWEKLMASVQHRVVDRHEVAVLVNPLLNHTA